LIQVNFVGPQALFDRHWIVPPGRFSMSRYRLLGVGLLTGLLTMGSAEFVFARTIDISKETRRCLSTSIAPSSKHQNALACVAHNACSRTIVATFDAYPFHARRTDAPMHAKVSHWIRPGDSEVFGWNSTNPLPAPECSVLESHY
jgi:hypothetical protein